jgi:hypothetical protein
MISEMASKSWTESHIINMTSEKRKGSCFLIKLTKKKNYECV